MFSHILTTQLETKAKMSFAKYFLLTCLLALAKSQNEDATLSRVMTLGDGKMEVSWTANFDTEVIKFVVKAQTTGFVGFGLSPQGGMVNSDLIIGGVMPNGDHYFTDRWASKEAEPEIDPVQNWFLIDANETDTHTTLEFYRNFATCDDKDWPINNDTIKFIWSIGETDEIKYHIDKGVASVNILDPWTPPVDTEGLDIWHLNVNTEIRTNGSMNDTSYWCTGHKSDKYTEKRHIVGYKVKMENELSVKHNHHMVLHKCQAKDSEEAKLLDDFIKGPGDECYEIPMQNVLSLCQTDQYVWAKGGDPLFLPEDVGFPLNEDNNAEYYLLEIHYDNPGAVEGIKYETGLEVYTAPPTRSKEAGLLLIGHGMGPSLAIPKESTDYVIPGHCSSRCTKERLDAEGITVFNVLLHAHLAGRKLKLRQFRPDVTGKFEELPWLSYDNMYDFNYQSNRALRQPVKILPGDHLSYECTYDTTWRQPPSVTMGGLSTRHEMCETFLMYYPKQSKLDHCRSDVGLQVLQIPGIGIEAIEGATMGTEVTVTLPEKWRGQYLTTVLDSLDWTKELREEMQRVAQYGDHYDECMGTGEEWDPNEPIYNTTYPTDFTAYVPPAADCGLEGLDTTTQNEVEDTTSLDNTTSSGNRLIFNMLCIVLTALYAM